MRYAPAVLFGTALLGLACAADCARAEQIQWYYSWSRSPDVIYADGSTTSYVSLSTQSQTKTLGTTTSPIEATNVFTYGGGPNGPPAEFDTGSSTQFTMTLNIWDPTVAQPGSVTFTGEVFGYLTPTTSHIQTFYTGQTTKSLTLGKDLYTIQLTNYAPSGPDCTTAQVTAVATVQTSPEPASVVLAGLALPAAGFFWLRRRKKRTTVGAP